MGSLCFCRIHLFLHDDEQEKKRWISQAFDVYYMNRPSPHLRVCAAISTAARPQSSPWLCPPSSSPDRSSACDSVSAVSTPKITGTPESSCTFMSPCETLSQMYSKCIVEPLISTPIAITASNGCFDDAPPSDGVPGRECRWLTLPSRLPPAWMRDPPMTLCESLLQRGGQGASRYVL